MHYHVYDPPPTPPKLDLRRIGGDVLPSSPSFSPALLDVPAEVWAAMAALKLSPAFVPPAQSRATRFINLRGRGSQRGALTARFGGIDRMVVFESLLELHCLHVLLADTAVVDIWDQPPLIEYRNIAGKWTHHTLDYRAEYADGQVIGYAVKPWRKVVDENGVPTEFALNMRRVRTAAGHEVRIVTEKSFSRIQLQDARTMHRWSRQTDTEADAVVRGIIPTLRGFFPVRTIRDLSELEGRAFGAVVRVFREGLLIKAERKRLDIDTLLQVNRHEH
jgi:hypothetical protein